MAAMRALRYALVLLPVVLVMTISLRADDGAASIAAGGLIVMKRETRIVMAKEVLSISASRVVVDYDFRNDSDEDITTEVAFPIPAYKLDTKSDVAPRWQGFDDFKLWVGGKPARFTIQLRAFVGKRDVTALLLAAKVDPGSMGHYTFSVYGRDSSRDTDRLNAAQRHVLKQAGAIGDLQDKTPLWRVEKKYYWSQAFPAHAIVHIRHEYTPVLGNSNSVGGSYVDTGKPESADEELPTVCPSPELRHALSNDSKRPGHVVGISYVDFILTTANTWKQPIEDFTLLVERPPLDHDPNHPVTAANYVSFCWNGPVTKIDADHFSAHTTNFVPAKELRVGFLQGYLMEDEIPPSPRPK
jgi:hypothetical protein